MKNTPGLTFEGTEQVMIKEIPLRMINASVRVNTEMEGLLSLAIVQNFVPVVDDSQIFIGIIRRREIIEYYASQSPKK